MEVESPKQKIINVIESVNQLDHKWISVEFFPPKTESGIENLFHALSHLKRHRPLFADFTWGAGGSTSELTPTLCKRAQKEHSVLVRSIIQ